MVAVPVAAVSSGVAAAAVSARDGVNPSAAPRPFVTGVGVAMWVVPSRPAMSDGRLEPVFDGEVL